MLSSISLCTKCHVCDDGYSLTVSLLLFAKIYHHLMRTWSFSPSIYVPAQNIGTQKNFDTEDSFDILILKIVLILLLILILKIVLILQS